LDHAFTPRQARLPRAFARLPTLYATEAVGAISGALLTVGLPFYTHHRFGWDARDNFLLGAGQGVAYVLGALSAQRLSLRWGRRTSLVALYAVLALFGMAIAWTAVSGSAALLVVLVLLEMALVAATWPLLESLVSADLGPRELSRQLGIYNITWAICGALTVALSGTVIQYAPPWAYFAIVAGGHLAAFALILSVSDDAGRFSERPAAQQCAVDPALARQRRLALWLSRISLPATYVVVYSLAPLFPSLPALRALSPASATVLASVWLVGRAVAFVITGRTTFWHARPRLLLWASVVMLAAFLGTVVPPILVDVALGPVVAVMVAAQAALGLSLGLIYAGSLYFGMVLSEGSTEHGGYHEALIGLGQVLGPGIGATVLWACPGSLGASIGAVSALLSVSLVLEAAAQQRARRAGPRV
jgi:MFS family permease